MAEEALLYGLKCRARRALGIRVLRRAFLAADACRL